MNEVWVVTTFDPDSYDFNTYVFESWDGVLVSINTTFEKIMDNVVITVASNTMQVVQKAGERKLLVQAEKRIVRSKATHL